MPTLAAQAAELVTFVYKLARLPTTFSQNGQDQDPIHLTYQPGYRELEVDKRDAEYGDGRRQMR